MEPHEIAYISPVFDINILGVKYCLNRLCIIDKVSTWVSACFFHNLQVGFAFVQVLPAGFKEFFVGKHKEDSKKWNNIKINLPTRKSHD